MTINIGDDGEGGLTLTCERSGRPLTRSNELGTFCDAPCACEQDSQSDFIAALSALFGAPKRNPWGKE